MFEQITIEVHLTKDGRPLIIHHAKVGQGDTLSIPIDVFLNPQTMTAEHDPVYELEVREFSCGCLGRGKSLGHDLRPLIKTGTALPVGLYKLYTAPSQREWVEPTIFQIDDVCDGTQTFGEVARAVLKLSKELNYAF